MPVYLIELVNPADDSDTRLMVWSTITDSPYTYGMTPSEMASAQADEPPGSREWHRLDCSPARLARVRAKGHSNFVYPPEDPDSRVACNRAGPDGSELTREEIWHYYVDMRPEGAVWCSLPDKTIDFTVGQRSVFREFDAIADTIDPGSMAEAILDDLRARLGVREQVTG